MVGGVYLQLFYHVFLAKKHLGKTVPIHRACPKQGGREEQSLLMTAGSSKSSPLISSPFDQVLLTPTEASSI